MHVIVPTKSLSAALRTTKPAMSSRMSSMPVLQHVRLVAHGDSLAVTATDMDLTITTPLDADVRVDGCTTALHKDLTVAAKGNGSMELVAEGEQMRAVGGITTMFPSLPDDFPVTPGDIEHGVGDRFTLDVDVVRSVIDAASVDAARPVICSVYFEPDGTLVATDSYRLHLVRDAHTSKGMLMPARALRAVLGHTKSGTVAIEQHESIARIAAADGTTWTTQLVESDFPNYHSLIPATWPHQIRFPRPAFTEAVASLAPVVRPIREGCLVIDADEARLRLSSSDGKANKEVPGSSPVRVGVNPDFLLDLLKGLTTCTISLTDELKPISVTERIDGRTHLRILMPVRIKN